MKNFKLSVLKFILYVYINHIKEDWSEYTRIGRMIIYPLWAIRSFLIWIVFPLFIVDYLIINSEYYKHIIETAKRLEKNGASHSHIR
jgi:hypothetical protein